MEAHARTMRLIRLAGRGGQAAPETARKPRIRGPNSVWDTGVTLDLRGIEIIELFPLSDCHGGAPKGEAPRRVGCPAPRQAPACWSWHAPPGAHAAPGRFRRTSIPFVGDGNDATRPADKAGR